MKIYTRMGDTGETGLPGGFRVPKDAAQVEVCGSVDELNTVLGMVRAEALPADIDQLLERIQHELFDFGAEVARGGAATPGAPTITAEKVAHLEEAIDRHEERLPPLTGFILSRGVSAAARLHHARAVCRRAERRLVTAQRAVQPPLSPQLLAYLNRLADLLFTLARSVNARAGCPEAPWRKDR